MWERTGTKEPEAADRSRHREGARSLRAGEGEYTPYLVAALSTGLHHLDLHSSPNRSLSTGNAAPAGMVYFIAREKKVVELSRRHSLEGRGYLSYPHL
uniref:Uncharacterized protein n=1 Tax=Oryza punctata TaxID=4537 RepID=A0A0E0LBQ3_ORYPU